MREVHPTGLALLALAALHGCGDAGPADVCTPGAERPIVGPRQDSRSGFAVLSDEQGYVVLWSGPAVEGDPDRGPVFAARPGQTPRRLNPGANAQALAAVAVSGGFLACWNSQSSSGGHGCLLLDGGLDVERDWRPAMGAVVKLARVGAQLYALVSPPDDPSVAEWRALDETGEPVGEPTTPPCTSRSWGWPGRMAWSGLGVACLVPSDVRCGRQLDEPSDCSYTLELHAPDGALRFAIPGIAPFGHYGATAVASVAARDDGLLVAWTDPDPAREWHAVPVSPTGNVGSRLDVPEAHEASIHAVGAGYLASFTGGVEGPGVSRWPMMLVVSPTGGLARPAERIAPPRDDLPLQYAPVAVGTVGDGVALVWEAAANVTYYPSALMYRSLGCVR